MGLLQNIGSLLLFSRQEIHRPDKFPPANNLADESFEGFEGDLVILCIRKRGCDHISRGEKPDIQQRTEYRVKKDWFIPVDRIFISSEEGQPVHEKSSNQRFASPKVTGPEKRDHVAIGIREMIFHIAGGFVYILVLSRMPDRRYGEILWQRAAVKGIKRPALSNRIPCIEQAFSISSIRPVSSAEVDF